MSDPKEKTWSQFQSRGFEEYASLDPRASGSSGGSGSAGGGPAVRPGAAASNQSASSRTSARNSIVGSFPSGSSSSLASDMSESPSIGGGSANGAPSALGTHGLANGLGNGSMSDVGSSYEIGGSSASPSVAPSSGRTSVAPSGDMLLDWLSSLQLAEYYDKFVSNDITLEMLPELRKDDLKELVFRVGDRIRMMKGINELKLVLDGSIEASPYSTVSSDEGTITALNGDGAHPLDALSSLGTSGTSVGTAGTVGSSGSVVTNASKALATAGSIVIDRDSDSTWLTVYPENGDPKRACVTLHDDLLGLIYRSLRMGTETRLWFLDSTPGAASGRRFEGIEVRSAVFGEVSELTIVVPHTAKVKAAARAGGAGNNANPINPVNAGVASNAANAMNANSSGNAANAANAVERPTSKQVSDNITDFFPNSNRDLLARGLRNSVNIGRRMSTVSRDWRASYRESRRFSRRDFDPIEEADSVGGGADSRGIAGLNINRARAARAAGAGNALGGTSVGGANLGGVNLGGDSGVGNGGVSLGVDLGPSGATSLAEVAADEDVALLEQLNSEDMSPSQWLRGKLIGRGSFGSVYLGFNVFSGDIMAVKQVKLEESDARLKKMTSALEHEIHMLRGLNHENIVQYRGFKREGEYLNIFLEYVPGGSLATKLAVLGPLPERVVQDYIRQCLHGLAYMHDKKIVHRDIKGANILVDTQGTVKISDFGLSKQETAGQNRFSMQGTAFWMAPEVARAKEQTTTKADIWSLGCVVVELLTGKHPYPTMQAYQVLFKVGKGGKPEIPAVSKELGEVLDRCFVVAPVERASARELLEMEFFKLEL